MDFGNATYIRRVPVPPGNRTSERDEAAECIEDMWPETYSNIAEASGFSRQHIKNTLELYFEPAEEPEEPIPDLAELRGLLNDDEEKLLAVFRYGYRMGWEDRGEAESK